MGRITPETPEVLRPYVFHGVDIDWVPGTASSHALADCPWCGSERKFSVMVGDGRWRCVKCNEGPDKGQMHRGGNAITFLRILHERSMAYASEGLESLRAHRSLLYAETLTEWGICRSFLDNSWLVPAYSAAGEINQVGRYIPAGQKWKLLATPTIGVGLYGRHLYDAAKPVVYLCEGPWDALALYEVLKRCKRNADGSFSQTGNPAASLLAESNVLAVPGCGTFFDAWIPLLTGKTVCILYDSDYPKKHPLTGAFLEPEGYRCAIKVARLLLESKSPPAEVKYLAWGLQPDGTDKGYNPALPGGYDVRDVLQASGDALGPRITAVCELVRGLVPVGSARLLGQQNAKSQSSDRNPPKSTQNGHKQREAKPYARKSPMDDLELVPCDSYKVLVNQFRKALKWTDGLDGALSAMLACVISTRSVGDQLWMKIISPPSAGKSTLCEALSSNKEYVLAKSTLRGFHSGYTGGGSSETDENGDATDYSLIAQVKNKTLITKDGDTLLRAPNLDQILSEARDVYDTVSRTSYRNSASRDYCGIRMSWILCGTGSLRELDSSELGERFLDYVIMEAIDDDLEDEVLMRVVHRAERNMSIEADGTAESHQEPEMTLVMALSGGYVQYLRDNAQALLDAVQMDDAAKYTIARLAKFVAHMRARPAKKQRESVEREFAARLGSQLTRLAKCEAAVLNRTSVDAEVMRRVRKVAFDTARGVSLELVRLLADTERQYGYYTSSAAWQLGIGDRQCKTMLDFLKAIGCVTLYTPEREQGGPIPKSRWVLTERFDRIYREVIGDPVPVK